MRSPGAAAPIVGERAQRAARRETRGNGNKPTPRAVPRSPRAVRLPGSGVRQNYSSRHAPGTTAARCPGTTGPGVPRGRSPTPDPAGAAGRSLSGPVRPRRSERPPRAPPASPPPLAPLLPWLTAAPVPPAGAGRRQHRQPPLRREGPSPSASLPAPGAPPGPAQQERGHRPTHQCVPSSLSQSPPGHRRELAAGGGGGGGCSLSQAWQVPGARLLRGQRPRGCPRPRDTRQPFPGPRPSVRGKGRASGSGRDALRGGGRQKCVSGRRTREEQSGSRRDGGVGKKT